MRRPILLIFILSFSFGLVAAREVTPFNDGWEFKKGSFSNDRLLGATIFSQKWDAVKIPHTWNARDMQNDKNNFYQGEAYYRKTFTAAESLKDKRVFLRFEGVAIVATVYVNGQHAGIHRGAYSAFAIDITSLLRFGKQNEIVVLVDSQLQADIVPVNNTLFGVYGGIYRPIEMIVTDKVNIAVTDYASPGIYLSQTNVTSKSADLNVKIKVDNKEGAPRNVTLLTTVYEANGNIKAKAQTNVALPPQGRQFFIQDIKILKPHLWQGLEDPYLYKTVVQIVSNGKVIDEVAQPLGLRHFDLIAGDGMYLNGKKTPMYGVCRHQDWWRLGSALTNKEHETDLQIIKEVGATTIRLAHYQQAEYMYAKSDSIGFMIWAEIPFVNRVTTKESENAKQQMTELIRQNYNHPSIYIWGLHNEVYSPSTYTIQLTTELNDLAKSEDPYRYTASVSGYNKVDQTVNNNADVQGINHYFGWYGNTIDSVDTWVGRVEKEFPNHRIIFSEYGAEANVNQQEEVVANRGRFGQPFYPETFSTRFHEHHWGVISKHPILIASYIWNTFDFATPMSSQGGVEARNMKGLVTFDRKTKKDPFYWYKANWSKEPVLYITQRRVVERENEVTPVVVYSNMGTPEIWVNGEKHTDFVMGDTKVHYIFKDIKLKAGDNIVVAKVVKDNKSYEDKVEWSWDPTNAKDKKANDPAVRNVQHVGL